MRFLFPAILALGLTGCSAGADLSGPYGPRDQDFYLTGDWKAVTAEHELRMHIREFWEANGTGLFCCHFRVKGTGSLTVLATGESMPFDVDGTHWSGGKIGALLNFAVPGSTTFETKYYGHFWGDSSSNSLMAGKIDGSVSNTVGPFMSTTPMAVSVRFVRQ